LLSLCKIAATIIRRKGQILFCGFNNGSIVDRVAFLKTNTPIREKGNGEILHMNGII